MVSPFFSAPQTAACGPDFVLFRYFSIFLLNCGDPPPPGIFPELPARAPARQADFPILTPPYEKSHMLLACSFQRCFSRNYPSLGRSVANKSPYAPPKEVKFCSRSVKKRFLFLLYQKFFKKSNCAPPSWGRSVPQKLSQYIYYIIFSQINQIKIFYRPYPIGLTFLKKYDIIIL